MYAYSKKYDTKEIWLLYPVNKEMRGHKPISFDSGDNTCVMFGLADTKWKDEELSVLYNYIIWPGGSAYGCSFFEFNHK